MTLASVCGHLCVYVRVWYHISRVWLFIHVSVRINFFFCMSCSNDQNRHTQTTRTLLKCNNHFVPFLFFVILLCEILGSYCYMYEMKWNVVRTQCLFFYFFLLSRKAFRQMFLLLVLSLRTFHSLITLDIFYCSLSRSLCHLHAAPVAMYLVLVLLEWQNSNNVAVYVDKTETWI